MSTPSPLSATAPFIAPAKPLRFAIIGLGGWAWRHVSLIRGTPGFELCAVCSRSDEAAARAAAELPEAVFYRESTRLLAEARPDVVVITTPHHTHAAFAIEALRAGAHVVVEKPMAATLPECRAMLAAARAAGRTLAVYHNRHWDPWLLAALAAVRGGRLGRLLSAETTWPYHFPPTVWRGLKHESGGQIFDVGAHMAEWLVQFAGEMPVAVAGHLVEAEDPAHNERVATAFLRFSSGATAMLRATAADLAPTQRFRLVGTEGTLVDDWNWNGGAARLWTGAVGTRTPAQHVELPYGPEDETGGGRPLYANLAEHFLRGAPLAVPPEQALRIVAILVAAQESAARGGAWIDFADYLGAV